VPAVCGRAFKESLQKALRPLETGLTGLEEIQIVGAHRADGSVDGERVCEALSQRAPENLLRIAQALRLGISVDAIHRACPSRLTPATHIEDGRWLV
jgi:carbamoyl-phosphate synthase large subunit